MKALHFTVPMILVLGCRFDAPQTDPVDTDSTIFSEFDVVVHNADALQPGTTMFGLYYDTQGNHLGTIYEVDNSGKVVWSYTLTPEQNPPGSILLDVEATPDSTILFTVMAHGVYEIDRKGQVLWSRIDPHVSHDCDKLVNGNVLISRGLAPQGEDQLIEVDVDNNIVWAWNGMDRFSSPEHADFVDEVGSWGHPNAVERLDSKNTLVTFRNFNVILELNSDGTVANEMSFEAKAVDGRSVGSVGAVRGMHPHDPELTEDGTSYLVALRQPQRVVQVDRMDGSLQWEWKAPEKENGPFRIRDANSLDNGNLLVTEGEGVYEVARDGSLVWELTAPVNPLAAEEETNAGKLLYKAIRIAE